MQVGGPFDPGWEYVQDVVRWVRLVFAWTLLSVCSVVMFARPVGVVHADGSDCEQVAGINVPSFLVGEEGLSMSLAGAPVIGAAPSLIPSTGGAVLTATTGAAGGTAAAGAALLTVAAMAAYGEGACYFLDVLNADRWLVDSVCGVGAFFGMMPGGQHGACDQTPPPSLVSHLGVTYGTQTFGGSCSSSTMTACAYRTFTFDTPVAASGSNQAIRVVMPWQTVSQGAVVIPESDWSAYDLPAEAWADFALRKSNGVQSSQHNVYPDSSVSADRITGATSVQIAHRNGLYVDPDGPGPTAATRMNIGGYQGIPPGAILTTKSANDVHPFTVMAPYYPEVNAQGWYRRYVTDAYCLNVSTEVGTWRRYSGPLFADKGSYTARPSVPRCQVGEAPAVSIITKVPANVACEVGYVCWPNSEVMTTAWPETWISEPPPFAPCLAVGNVCNPAGPQVVVDPETDEETCVWEPSKVIEMTYCAGGKVDLGGVVDGGLTTTEVVDVSDTPVGDPTSTGTPVVDIVDPKPDPTPGPGGPNVNVTVNIPIDDGGEEAPRVVCPVGVDGPTCLPSDEAECLPNGWGWFNPITWVLKPVKCALEWAFVPSDPGGWAHDQWDSLSGEIPFSYAVTFVSFFDVITDPTPPTVVGLPCYEFDLPDYDDGNGITVDGGTGEACLDIEAQAAVAQGTPFLSVLLQWCMVGWLIWKFMLQTIGAIL